MSMDTPGQWGAPSDAPFEERQTDIREYLRMFRRRWWLAALTLLACVGAAVGATMLQPKIYEGRTRLFVGQQTISRSDIQFAQGLTQTSLALVKSYSEAIKSLPLAQDVVTRLGLQQDPQALLDQVTAAPVGETQIIRLTYTDRSPQRAEEVTNALAEAFIAAIQRIDRQSTGEAAVQVSVLEPAVRPTSPSSPKPVRNAAAGVLLGLVLAWGVVLLAERLDATVKGRQDAEEISGLPALALVPTVKTKSGQLLRAAGSSAGEAFKLLRTAIRFMGSADTVKVLAVSSPEAGDGKTTTAYNLAAAFAESGVVTVLIEADMRKPSLARQLHVSGRGLAAYLTGTTTMKGLVQRTPTPNLFLVPSGPTPSHPPELLGSTRMGKLVRSLSKEAGIVILDTPPVLAVSDAIALTPMVDGMVLVVRAGKTGKERIREALRVLGGVGAPVMGLVLNSIDDSAGYYGYGYYGYGQYAANAPANGVAHAPQALETAAYAPREQAPAPANGHHPKRSRRPVE